MADRSPASILIAGFLVVASLARDATADAIYGWGQGGYGNLANGSPANLNSPVASPVLSSGVTAFAAGGQGYGFSVAVKDGTLYGFGYSQYGQYGSTGSVDTATPRPVLNVPGGPISAVAAGAYHTLLLQSGGIVGIGLNGYGELGIGTRTNATAYTPVQGMTSGVSQIVAGTYFSMAVKDGAAYAWGYNGFGVVGDGTTTDRLNATLIPILASNVSKVACANVGNTALAAFGIKGGTLFSWGNNSNGQLGDGTTTDHLTPAIVPALASGVTDIAGGVNACLAIKNGQVYSWGKNDYGQLGDGTINSHYTPTLVPGLSNIVQVAQSGSSSFALSADGSLWVWGFNGYGDLGLGDATPRRSPTQLLPPTGLHFTGISISQDSVLATAAIPEPAGLTVGAMGAMLMLFRGKPAWSGSRRRLPNPG